MALRVIQKSEFHAKFHDAPLEIREAYASEETYQKILALVKELQVPETVQKVLGTEVGYAILGLRKPEETKLAFTTAGASEALASSIVNRIAKNILAPLRSSGGQGVQKEKQSVIAPKTPGYIPVDHQLPDGHPEKKIPPQPPKPPAPTAPARLPTPPPTTPRPSAPSGLSSAIQQAVRPRTMASDVEAMQPSKGEHKPKPEPVAPKPMPTPARMDPVVTPKPSPAIAKVGEDLKKYGVDPYREPVE